MTEQLDVAIIGSGPNGLTAGALLSKLGLSVSIFEKADRIGGGTRTEELVESEILHDVCSAVHPLGAGSPVFKKLELENHGLKWIHPELPLAQPLNDGDVVTLNRSIDITASQFENDEDRYVSLLNPYRGNWDRLALDILGPPIHFPRNPLLLARFAKTGILSAKTIAKKFSSNKAAALFAGLAAHSIVSLDRRLTGAVGLTFAIAAHEVGWPIAEGGSQQIAAALASIISSNGGEFRTGQNISTMNDLPKARSYIFDTTPFNLGQIAGNQLNTRFKNRLNAYKSGSAAFKVDYILSSAVPWTNIECRKAGTVHVGASYSEIQEALVAAENGRTPSPPFLIVSQPTLIDKTRTHDNKEVLWVYAHVPNGYDEDLVPAIENQIERFAPGFKDTIVAKHVMSPRQLEEHNPNYIGGDIANGAFKGLQAVFRPTIAINPYTTSSKQIFLASSATPPGAGVHGMCGYYAARNVAEQIFGKKLGL